MPISNCIDRKTKEHYYARSIRMTLHVLMAVIYVLATATSCGGSSSPSKPNRQLVPEPVDRTLRMKQLYESRDAYLKASVNDLGKSGELIRAHIKLVEELESSLGLRRVRYDIGALQISTHSTIVLQVERYLVTKFPSAVSFNWQGLLRADHYHAIELVLPPYDEDAPDPNANEVTSAIELGLNE